MAHVEWVDGLCPVPCGQLPMSPRCQFQTRSQGVNGCGAWAPLALQGGALRVRVEGADCNVWSWASISLNTSQDINPSSCSTTTFAWMAKNKTHGWGFSQDLFPFSWHRRFLAMNAAYINFQFTILIRKTGICNTKAKPYEYSVWKSNIIGLCFLLPLM